MTARGVGGCAWAYLSSCRMSSVFACHPGLGDGRLNQNHFLSSPGPSMLYTQRPHTRGCAPSLPTSARCCVTRTPCAFFVGLAYPVVSLPLLSSPTASSPRQEWRCAVWSHRLS